MKYPIGIQDFEQLRTEGYEYVDKTAYIHKLVDTGKFYFLSRPRRFGKSLLLSTMKAYFEGKRTLFKGLAIDSLSEDWQGYPVLYLDLNTKNYVKDDDVLKRLDAALCDWEELYGGAPHRDTELRFESVIKCAYNKTGKPVVILVDEYDKPLLQIIDNDELRDIYIGQLKAFYANLKSMGRYIKFAFLTGVTKFGKISVFSDLNNLNDVSLDTAEAGICGITATELHQYFEPGIRQLADKYKVTYEQMLDRLKEQYDGYRFSEEEAEDVYNPFSLLNTFYKNRMGNYWFETGTPTFLVKLLQKHNYDLSTLDDAKQTSDMMEGIDTWKRNPVPVIYQSGYLTIKDFDWEFRTYTLGFPNKEVEYGFTEALLEAYAPKGEKAPFHVQEFVKDIRQGNPEQFMQRMQAFFADGNYLVAGDAELYFQNCMYLIFRFMGFYTQVETPSSHGRSDIEIITPQYIYIIEIKLDRTATEALQQIDDSGYADRYAMDSRRIFKIGVEFSLQTRGIVGWEIVS